jgi:hypothetical protein
MITEKAFADSAKRIGCKVAAVKAVCAVESRGSGFLADGKTPMILFEPHIFWKELRKRGVDPNKHVAGNEDILYPTWKPGKYGPVSAQHTRLQKACNINREAALASASWGLFQILGNNYKEAGYSTIQDFINDMYKSEDDHLEAFTGYVINTHLDDELRELDWKGFARGYNGPAYAKNQYDTKLARAYQKFNV